MARRMAIRMVRVAFEMRCSMSNDAFKYTADGAAHPARQAFSVVPHDSQELTILPKALRVFVPKPETEESKDA